MTLAPPPAARTRTQNAAQWWRDLGCIPLERIIMDPLPGTATEADVTRLDDHEDRLCELVNGTLVEKTLGYRESLVACRIAFLLGEWHKGRHLGLISGETGMMRLLGHQVRIPDVAFVSWDRLPDRRVPDEPIPDLAVEVISPSNTADEMQNKLREYFAAGGRLVWFVDPHLRTVEVYTSPTDMTRLRDPDTLTGGDVLPDFETTVATLFDVE